MANVYFVVVGWNNKDLIDSCLSSIQKQTYSDYKIIYVDNGSSDDSLSYIKKHYPAVIGIDAQKNQGFAIGNNIGIKQALEDRDCKYVALLNTDATLDKHWLSTLIKFADVHPNTASLQTPTLDYYDHSILDSRGIKIDTKGRAIQLGYREKETTYRSHRVFGVNAAACIYTSVFLRNQPFGDDYFDSDLWMYLEDVDLAARAIMLGYDNWLVTGSFAYHMGSISSGKNPGFSVYYIYRNNALMVLKNLSLLRLLLMAPGMVYSDSMVLVAALRGRNYIAARKLVKGRLHSLRLFGLFMKKAGVLKRGRKVTSRALKNLMSAR